MTAFLRAWKTGRAQSRAARAPASILHPRSSALLALVLALLAGSGLLLAQSRPKPERRGPRALAVLELLPNGRTQLVPVTILDSGKFYDAGLYRAAPRPMALEDGVVYEGEHTGESLGLFTVTGAQKVEGGWVGLGRWRATTPSPPVKAATGRASNAPTDSASGRKDSGKDSDDMPVLRRPKPQPDRTSDAGPPRSDERRSSEPAASKSPRSEPQDSEPADRPTLRRGKPSGQDQEPDFPPLVQRGGTKPGTPPSEPAKAAASTTLAMPPGTKFLAAISDAGGPEPRSFTYEMDSQERQRLTANLSAMAYAAVTRFASSRPGHKPGPASALTPVDVRVFDVHLNNEPVLVFSARVPELGSATRGGLRSAKELEYWVTVVARVDMYHELRPLLAHVTDSGHLDVYPRLELIDAVDADGNGTGELLFRENFERGYSFILYRVGMDKLWELFDGAKSRS